MSNFQNDKPQSDISYRCLQPWMIDEIEQDYERRKHDYDEGIQPRIEEDSRDPRNSDPNPFYVPQPGPGDRHRGIEIIKLFYQK